MRSDDPDEPPTQPTTPESRAPITIDKQTTTRFERLESDDTKALEGYMFGEVIGRGGIGEIVAAHDLRVGRDVAIKRLRAGNPTDSEVQRFLREARIQARLEHPAIPPVHELGRDAAGRPYFSMKRLAGTTMAELLAMPEHDRPRLLRAFVEVCQAIDFAHSRGVVHRDLKPGNVMLGDFGDVYVLDWGLARVVGEAITEVVTDDIDSLDVKSGDLLGTPGYMAPEQIQRVGDTGRPADVYALGAILFEILAGEPLHPRGPTAVASTVGNEANPSASKRRPDRAVPPELDALCASMLAMDPSTRPTARRVAERVQAYLDGDRDVARRRTMAVDLVWVARAALNEGRRADAMRAAGRALALDVESREAAEIVSTLMLQPPEEPPPEVEEALRAADAAGVSKHARTSVLAYVVLASFLPVASWNGIRDWDIILGIAAMAGVLALFAVRFVLRPRVSTATLIVYALGNAALMAVLTRAISPWTFVPALTCIIMMSMMAYPQFSQRPWILISMFVIGFSALVGLEIRDVIAPGWEIRDGAVILHGMALEITKGPTTMLLFVANVATIVVAGIHASATYRAGRQAQKQLVMQAWHLRQLLPNAAAAK
ncbi:MAG TPA: serine/threonine-protein kinase [Kofleriaceae bacterium]|nr:serine/threonine-protein kinase [Kofleriaceae bacterium]